MFDVFRRKEVITRRVWKDDESERHQRGKEVQSTHNVALQCPFVALIE